MLKVYIFAKSKLMKNGFLSHAVLLIMFFIADLPLSAQRIINYSYDAAGNRIGREEAAPVMLLMENADISTEVTLDDSASVFIATDKNRSIEITFKNKLVKQEETTGNYILYDAAGRITKKAVSCEKIFNLELETLPRGIYVLRIQCNNKIVTRKIKLN